MAFKTSALIASIISLPIFVQGVDIIGYNGPNCNQGVLGQGDQGVLTRCNNVAPGACCNFPVHRAPDRGNGGTPTYYTYGSVGFTGLTDLDTSYWSSGNRPGCTGPNEGPPQRAGADRCHQKAGGRTSYTTLDVNSRYLAGGGSYDHERLPGLAEIPGIPPPGPYRAPGYIGNYAPASGGYRRRRLAMRAEQEAADAPKEGQCPSTQCGEMVIPTIYVKEEGKDGVWVLDPLPKDKYDAFQKDVTDGKKSEVDIVKDYAAKWVDDAAKVKEIQEPTEGGSEQPPAEGDQPAEGGDQPAAPEGQ